MAITIDDFSKIWASTSPLTPYEFSENNYKSGWNFIGSTPPSRQMWDFLQKQNDEKLKYLLDNFDDYLPLSGGTMKGNITFSGVREIMNATNTDSTFLDGGTYVQGGSNVLLYGKDHSSRPGHFIISARKTDGTGVSMQGKPDGSLVWNGQPIQTSSDKRLKTDFADVPNDVLEAWSKVEWKQFKYIADKERKGDSCRWHTGLVAQDVKEVGDANNVDLLKYGILCHDVQEATEEQEAVDLWTIRYEEALAMEVIYLRNEIKKLREEIKALRTE